MFATYPGDDETKASLLRFQSKVSLEELKAALMGSILAVEMVQPSRVLKIVYGEDVEEHPQFESIEDAKEHMGILMALWTKLAEHQKFQNPFRFSPVPNLAPNDLEGWLEFARLRESEFTFFLRGLYAGNTPSASELHEPTEEDLRTYLPLMLEVGRKGLVKMREEIEQGTSEQPPGAIGALGLSVDQIYLTLYDDFLKQSLLWRREHMDELRSEATHVRSEPKVGRNDRCPCGSGRKYKHCCLH